MLIRSNTWFLDLISIVCIQLFIFHHRGFQIFPLNLLSTTSYVCTDLDTSSLLISSCFLICKAAACTCSAVPHLTCRVSPTSVLCQDCASVTRLPLLQDTVRPAGTSSWDVSETEKKERCFRRRFHQSKQGYKREGRCRKVKREGIISVHKNIDTSGIFFNPWRRTVTELSDRRQETEILPAVRNEVDTKDTGCQRGCAALIKGGKKAQYSVG